MKGHFSVPNFMDDTRYWGGKGCRPPGFDEKPFRSSVDRLVEGEGIQGHRAFELEVLGLVDDGHPPAPASSMILY